jgi:solute carrier family 25 protein 33/36
MRDVVRKEGFWALFKGVGPNVIGVAPSKAVYFYAYSSCKRFLNDVAVPNTPWIHMASAGSAGFLTASVVNPIWLIKTRLQLDRHFGAERLTILQCMKRVYQTSGPKGFWKGVTASYVGIFETIVQFVLYEYLRATFVGGSTDIRENRDKADFVQFMLCGGVSKLFATSLWYPHEVCRTRLREEGSKYRTFFQTLTTVRSEEGWRGLYRGLGVHLLRTIPNTAITMGTYELAVYVLAHWIS